MKNIFTMVFSVISLACLFATPLSAEPGVTNNQILVGMSTVLTGPASFLGTSFKTGSEACLKAVNAAGGVNGRKIKLIAYDDGY